MDLKGKVALVTGGGRRLGKEIALALAARGAQLAVHYNHSAAQAEATVATINGAGGRALALHADLERVAEIRAMVARIDAELGGLDLLINSASVFSRKPMNEISERDWDSNFNVNLKAPFFIAQFAAPLMRRAGAGKIVNLGDLAAVRPFTDYFAYSVSKSGLVGLTRALAKALAPQVQVNCLALGPVLPPEDYPPPVLTRLAAGTLVKRLGTPQDVVNGVLLFCEGSDFVTGATLTVDGGMLLA
ncbi:MAG TPA: SDR family oxidoreductase [Candidatus Binataceae bacterium]|nr:SDR family oxidoreductase [Candidatus Binataceae bacterium]